MSSEVNEFLETIRQVDERDGSVAALEALKKRPFDNEASYFGAYGTLAARTGNLVESIHAFEQCCALEAGSAVYRANLGMALLDLAIGLDAEVVDEEMVRRALIELQQATALDKGLGYALAGLGFAYHLLGQWDHAAEYLDRAVTVEPELIMAWYHRGELMRSLDRIDEAKRCFEKALSLDSQCEPAHVSLAQLEI